MSRIIPLLPNKPYQQLSVALGDYTLRFEFSYVQRFGYYRVNISDLTSQVTLTNGRIANAGVNLLSGFFGKYGHVYIAGDQPTLDNLGSTSRLTWEAPDA